MALSPNSSAISIENNKETQTKKALEKSQKETWGGFNIITKFPNATQKFKLTKTDLTSAPNVASVQLKNFHLKNMHLVFQELALQTSQLLKIIKFYLAFHNLTW